MKSGRVATVVWHSGGRTRAPVVALTEEHVWHAHYDTLMEARSQCCSCHPDRNAQLPITHRLYELCARSVPSAVVSPLRSRCQRWESTRRCLMRAPSQPEARSVRRRAAAIRWHP